VRRRRLLAAGSASIAGLAALAGCGGSGDGTAGGGGSGTGERSGDGDGDASGGSSGGTNDGDGSGGPDASTPTPTAAAGTSATGTRTRTPSGNLGPELVVVNRDAVTYRVAVRIRPEEGESVFEGFISVPGGGSTEREVLFDGAGSYLVEVRIRSEEARDRWTVEAADPRTAVVVTIEDGAVTFGRRTPG
jgi:hypothetical protein